MEERTPGIGLSEAISQMAEAVRFNPDNEDAKYNLELLKKIQQLIQKQTDSTSTGSSGATSGEMTDDNTGY
jgi:hypothetical protein